MFMMLNVAAINDEADERGAIKILLIANNKKVNFTHDIFFREDSFVRITPYT